MYSENFHIAISLIYTLHAYIRVKFMFISRVNNRDINSRSYTTHYITIVVALNTHFLVHS